METLRKFWPWSFRMEKGNVKKLVWTVVIYVLVGVGIGIVLGLLSFIPYVGILTSIVGYICDLYLTAGVVFCFLNYFEVGPFKN